MHDVATTSKTIASARRPDIFIASPRSRSDRQAPAFFRPYRPQPAMGQRLLVAYPTSGLRSHTFRPVEVRRMLDTDCSHDSSRTSLVAHLNHDSLRLQLLPAHFLPWRAPASHPED